MEDSANIAFKFDLMNIKTPQLIGIVAGCLVFSITISVVIYLLVKSGSFGKFLEEMTGSSTGSVTEKKALTPPQIEALPLLYDHLLEAAKKLLLKPALPQMAGKNITIRELDLSKDIPLLLEACNGSPLFGECAYDPSSRLWGFMRFDNPVDVDPISIGLAAGTDMSTGSWPSTSADLFTYAYRPRHNAQHLVVVDNILTKPVGMISLVDHSPRDLSLRIDGVWLTPAYQGKRYPHEAILLILTWLFENNYRRVAVEVDLRHIIMRRLLERCGFTLEATIRKHKIVGSRNSDTALYVVLNSDWEVVEIKLKRYLELELRPKKKSE